MRRQLVGNTIGNMRSATAMDIETRLAAATEVASARGDDYLYGVATALREQVLDDPNDPIWWVIWGLEYQLLDEELVRRRVPAEIGWSYTEPYRGPALPQAPAEAVDSWDAAAGVAPTAFLKAHFHTLAWVRNHGPQPHLHARAAVDSYLAAATSGWGWDVHRRNGLLLALSLALSLRDDVRQAKAIGLLVTTADVYLCADRAPGIVIPIIEALHAVKTAVADGVPSRLLGRALQVYADDPWSMQALLDVRASTLPPEQRMAVHEEKVRVLLDFASRMEGAGRFGLLHKALELATDHALGATANAIKVTVEQMSSEDIGLRRVSASVTMARDGVDQMVDFLAPEDIWQAFEHMAMHCPSGQSMEHIRAQAGFLADQAPLRASLSSMRIGPHNSVLTTATTDDEREERLLVEVECGSIQLTGLLLVEAFERLAPALGATPNHELVAWFTAGPIDAASAELIVKAFRLYLGGDADSAASVLVPRLERAIRQLCLHAGLAVTRPPNRQTGRSGGVKGLGELVADLEGVLDEVWRRYYRALLCDPMAINLRNRIGHGLVDSVTRPHAAMLLQAALTLRWMGPAKPTL